jgi:hypothetical protein
MAKLGDEVGCSIDLVFIVEGIIEHRADELLLLGGLAGVEYMAHVCQPVNCMKEQGMGAVILLVELIELGTEVVSLPGIVPIPTVVGFEIDLVGYPFFFE